MALLAGRSCAAYMTVACAVGAAACGNGEVGQAHFELLSHQPGGEPQSRDVLSWTHRVEDGLRLGEGSVHYYSEFGLAEGQLGQLDIEIAAPGDGAAPELHYREESGDGRIVFESRAVEAHLVASAPTSICECADLHFDARFIDPGPDDALGTGDDVAREMLGGQLIFDSECLLPSPASRDGGIDVQYAGTCPGDYTHGSATGGRPAGAQPGSGGGASQEVVVVVHEEPSPIVIDTSGCGAAESESTGCESTGSDESSGCESDTADDSESSGCESDTGGGSESSGCEGDTVDDSSGCEDDSVSRRALRGSAARYACVTPSRSPWSGPLQNYLMIAVAALWQARRCAQLRPPRR